MRNTDKKAEPTRISRRRISEMLKRLRKFRGRLPPDFRFDRQDANERELGYK